MAAGKGWPVTSIRVLCSWYGSVGCLDRKKGLPTRAGYFVGYRIVRALSHQYTVADIARRAPDHILQEEIPQLEELPELG
jgi:uncharacterized protein YjaZ